MSWLKALDLAAAGAPAPPGSSLCRPHVTGPACQCPLASLLAVCALFHVLISCGGETWLKGLFRL